MVVLEIDIQGGFARPAEGDPVIPGHPHRPTFRFALQAVEVKTGDVQLLRTTCYFQQLQDANALSDMIGANPASLAGEINLFKSLVSELADHFRSVDYLVYSVKRLPWGRGPRHGERTVTASQPAPKKGKARHPASALATTATGMCASR